MTSRPFSLDGHWKSIEVEEPRDEFANDGRVMFVLADERAHTHSSRFRSYGESQLCLYPRLIAGRSESITMILTISQKLYHVSRKHRGETPLLELLHRKGVADLYSAPVQANLATSMLFPLRLSIEA